MSFLHRGAAENAAQTLIRQTIGPASITKAQVQAFGTIGASLIGVFEYYSNMWTAFDQDFGSGYNNNVGAQVFSSSGGNFYDKATVYYQYYAMTGDIAWKNHADGLVATTKSWFYVPNNYIHAFLFGWTNPRSMYMDYLLNGHTDSRDGIALFADWGHFNAPQFSEATGQQPHHDTAGGSSFGGRELGRYLQSVAWADHLGLPSPGGHNFASDRATMRNAMLSYWIDSNGAVRPNNSWRSKIYQNGLIADCMIDDYKLVVKAGGTPDSRIIPAIQRMIDYGWNVHFRGRFGGSTYLDGPNTEDGASLSHVAAHLNSFPGTIAWWVGVQLGATGAGRPYIDMGDRWFIEALQSNTMAGYGSTTSGALNYSKNWNEFITQIFTYLPDRIATGIPFPTSSRNYIDKPWTPGQTFTLTGTGSSFSLYDSPGNGIWASNLRARAQILASVAAGTKTAFLQIDNSGFAHSGTVAALKPITITTTPTYVGYLDEVLVSDGDGSIRILLVDNSDGLGSRTIRIDAVELGAGDSLWTPPAEPNLQILTPPSYSATVDGDHGAPFGAGPRLTVNGSLATSNNQVIAVGDTLAIVNGTYETVASPPPASFIYDWWINGQLVPGATAQTFSTTGRGLVTGDGVWGRETPVSAGSVAGRPNTTPEVNVNAVT